jgi:hypothetical protein
VNERGCKKASVEPRGVSLRANVAEDVLGRVAFTAPQGDDDAVEEGADVEDMRDLYRGAGRSWNESASRRRRREAIHRVTGEWPR